MGVVDPVEKEAPVTKKKKGKKLKVAQQLKRSLQKSKLLVKLPMKHKPKVAPEPDKPSDQDGQVEAAKPKRGIRGKKVLPVQEESSTSGDESVAAAPRSDTEIEVETESDMDTSTCPTVAPCKPGVRELAMP